MALFTNISTYQFAPLRDLKPLRAKLLALCIEWQLKGTILLSTEGINLFVAGGEKQIGWLLDELRRIPGLEGLTPKFSESAHQPFSRMLVRIKKEIIAFGVEGIDPSKRTSPKLAPQELKKWLDEGREVTLLDTRNDYEIKLGSFEKAHAIGVKHFREFPAAVGQLPADWKEKPIVMFCTGGIRCEKAGPYMESQGFKSIYQLDGGILKYFEECGNAHYEGDCFVFDQRVGVDPTLQETPNAQCFACLTPLTAQEQADPRYFKGRSCPYCFKSSEDKMHEAIEARHARIAELSQKLPGSEPYEHRRPMKVPAKYAGWTVFEFVSRILHHVATDDLTQEFQAGRFLAPSGEKADPSARVIAGERYYHCLPLQSEPDVSLDLKILYEDEALIVLEKPAPLPVHPGGRFNRNTLQNLLSKVYAPQKPHPAHRLDANTTGLMLVARTRHFASLLQPQFFRGEVEKSYVARVQGHPVEDSFCCDEPISEGTLEVGARFIDEKGLASRTEFKVLKRYSDGTSLLEARPITGRTNQIRVHLWHLGFPICGEQMYLSDRRRGCTQTAHPEDAPLCLHAQSIAFNHPVTRQRLVFEGRKVDWA